VGNYQQKPTAILTKTTQITKRGAVLTPLPVFYQNQLNNSTIERLNSIFIS